MARRVPHKSSGKGKRAMQRKARAKAMGRSHMVLNRALAPIPQRFITKMKYSEFVSADVFGIHRFNLNSIYDPNRTGVGHQPYGFDTLASLYNRYRVIACGYRIHVAAGTGTSGSQSFQVVALPANEELSTSSLSEWRENPRAKYICQNAGAPTVFLKGKTYIPSLVGRTRAQYMADDRYQATTAASPNELAILNLAIGGGADTLTAGAGIQILLEYTVEFFDIKHLAQS